MKKAIALLMAAAFVLSACETKEPAKDEVTSTAERLTNIGMYRKEKLALPEKCAQVWGFMPFDGGLTLIGMGTKSPQFWRTSDMAKYTEVDIPDFDIGANYGIDTANDGTLVTFVVHSDSERDENGEFPANAEFRFVISTYRDGRLESSADVEDFGAEATKSTSIGNVWTDGEIVIAKIAGSFEVFTIDGKYVGELTSKDGDIDTIGKNRDGRLICSLAYTKNDVDKLKLCLVAPDGSLSDYNGVVYDFSETPQGIQQGMGDLDLFLYTRSTIYGLKQGETELTPLIDLLATSLTSDMINGIWEVDGDIAIMSNDFTNFKVNFDKYLPVTKDELADFPVLTVGSVGGGNRLKELVSEWNDAGHDFLLEYKDYEISGNGSGVIEMKELRENMLLGKLPDVMWYTEDYDVQLEKNGAFCDLFEFIDKDGEFGREKFVPNVLECFSRDGALYRLPTFFSIDVGAVAKAKFIGSADEWSFDKKVDWAINSPAMAEIDHDSKYTRLGAVSYTEWLDRANFTCHYDDGIFAKFLDWCNIPDNIQADYSDVEEPTEEERELALVADSRKYMDDVEIIDRLHWNSYKSYVQDTRGKFGGEELTFLDEPTLDPITRWSITAASDKKELAWEFIKSQISDEKYAEQTTAFQRYSYGFPVTKAGIEMYLAANRNYLDYSSYEEITDPEWVDYKGVVYQMGSCIYGENVMKLGEITDADVAYVNELIARAKSSETIYVPLGNDYYEIMEEEIQDFFNGKTTSAECAKYIQNRVSTLLSERS